MGDWFKPHYRINRDWFDSDFWMVQRWVWFWPFWVEACGLLDTKEDAIAMIDTLVTIYTPAYRPQDGEGA